MKQDAQTNQTIPTNKSNETQTNAQKKNQIKPTERDGRRACELQLGRETQRKACRERKRAQCVRDFQITPRVCVGI